MDIEENFLKKQKQLFKQPSRIVMDRRICESQLSTSRQLRAARDSQHRFCTIPLPPPSTAPLEEIKKFWKKQARTSRLQAGMQKTVVDVEIVNQNEELTERFYEFEQLETVRFKPLNQRLMDEIWNVKQEILRVIKIDDWVESVLMGRISVQMMQLRRIKKKVCFGYDFE